jgi:hypothetical protein
MIISSQAYRDPEIVAQKKAAKDYVVLVSPEFEYEGAVYRVVLDGHHSLQAALDDCVEPQYRTATNADCDTLHLLDTNPGAFLAYHHMGADWCDALDGSPVW